MFSERQDAMVRRGTSFFVPVLQPVWIADKSKGAVSGFEMAGSGQYVQQILDNRIEAG